MALAVALDLGTTRIKAAVLRDDGARRPAASTTTVPGPQASYLGPKFERFRAWLRCEVL